MDRLLTRRNDSNVKPRLHNFVLYPSVYNNDEKPIGWSQNDVDMMFQDNIKHISKKRESSLSTIPEIVHQTYHTKVLPSYLNNIRYDLMKKNSGFIFKLYDNTECRNFISQHFNMQVLWAFDNLKSNAYKADLFRYCVLYIEGGVYLDIKYTSTRGGLYDFVETISFVLDIDNSIQTIIKKNNRDTVNKNIEQTLGLKIGHPRIFNGIIAITPKHEIMKACIDKTVSNVVNDLICSEHLSSLFGMHRISGSEMMAEIIKNNSNGLVTTKIVERPNNGGQFYIDSPNKNSQIYTDNTNKNTLDYGEAYFTGDIYNYPLIVWKSTVEIEPTMLDNELDKNNKYKRKQTLVVLKSNIHAIKTECYHKNQLLQLIEINTDTRLMHWAVTKLPPTSYDYGNFINRRFKLVTCDHNRKPLRFSESFIIDKDETWKVDIKKIDFEDDKIVIIYSKGDKLIKVINNFVVIFHKLKWFDA